MKANKQMSRFKKLVLAAVCVFVAVNLDAQNLPKETPTLQYKDGNLEYTPDEFGNRIPDFSFCGYQASSEKIPMVPAVVVVNPVQGDATASLQKAIDYVSSLPLDENGFRGAILLKAGNYQLNGRFTISKSGIVIRGAGFGEDGTVLTAAGLDRETLFRVEGEPLLTDTALFALSQSYVPVGAMSLELASTSGIEAGDVITITRPTTEEWIDLLQMSEFGGETSWLGWKPGERDICWYRTVTKVEGNTVSIDAPITTALDQQFGGAYVQLVTHDARIQNIGIENLSIVSEFDSLNKKDEAHCWNGISFEHATNAWVRQVKFKHLAGSAVAVYGTASKVTIEDCLSLEPVSEIAAWRRNSFFVAGQQCLVQRCYAEFGYHDFATGFCTAGPNAFVQCESHLPYSFSGTADSWASGILFDIVNVDGEALSLSNREMNLAGAGWTAANCMLWQCAASRIECYEPLGANNWAYGAWAQFAGNGYWESANEHVKPRSLFYAQLADRLGADQVPANPVIEYTTDATSSPSVELAAELTEYAETPAITLPEFIEQSAHENLIATDAAGAKELSQIKLKETKAEEAAMAPAMTVENGWLVRGNQVLTGKRQVVPWWSGNVRPRGIRRAKPAITRFVPGLQGMGYTDKLTDVIDWMKASNIIGMEQNYALWYDRRRDDHERTRRIDGEAWAPFLELPFARTGEGLAWDGLSKYDLTKYNSWYWGRLKQFADMADQEGLLLVHQNYFQHNIIEAGAHWVDSPWRTVNNINNTGFPEPVPFAGDKRVFMDKHFYDVSNPVRRELHRKYIRQCLENFQDNSGVIQLISAEYTGPLHFMQFWLDVIAEWEAETGHDAMVGLSATKDVQDAILADSVRSKIVDLIDIRYWSHKADGDLWAPKGGQHLAPRQHMRLEKIGKRSFEQVYSDVFQYRQSNPEKAVIYSFDQSDNYAWAIFMAGGSLAGIPAVEVPGFLDAASQMHAVETTQAGIYELAGDDGSQIVYLDADSEPLELELPKGNFRLTEIDPATGAARKAAVKIKGGEKLKLDREGQSRTVYFLYRK